MILSSEGPGHFGHFGWEVPKDTVDLSIEVLCEPLKSLHGSAELSAKCAGHNGDWVADPSSHGFLDFCCVLMCFWDENGVHMCLPYIVIL